MRDLERIEEDLYWLSLMIKFAEKVLLAKEEMKSLEESKISGLLYLTLQDGIASNLAHIGEQLDSSKLSKETQLEFDYIEWSDIKRFRDKHDHWYQDISHDLVDEIIEESLPELYYQLLEIKEILESRLSEM